MGTHGKPASDNSARGKDHEPHSLQDDDGKWSLAARRPGDPTWPRWGPASRVEAGIGCSKSCGGRAFGPELKSDQQKTTKVIPRPHPDEPTPSQPSYRFSLKRILLRLGLLDQTNGSGSELPTPQLLVTRLEAQIQKLELRLKTEQALCQMQREELSKLRVQVNRIEVLEADLVIERESSSRLVHWLQAAEEELADLRQVAATGSTCVNPNLGQRRFDVSKTPLPSPG